MYEIQVSEATFRALELAGRLTGMTPSQMIERLVSQSVTSGSSSSGGTPTQDGEKRVAVYADYNGQRVKGYFSPQTKRIDVTTGPLAGTKYKSPSAAARAVVSAEKPTVNSNRNGWGFWYIDDGSGRLLQQIRYDN